MSSSIVGQLRERGQDALADLYIQYRKEFLKWAEGHFNCTQDEAKDAYQQAIIILYDNFLAGKLDGLTGSEKTYLFAIGKNKLYEHFRRVSKNIKINGFDWTAEESIESANNPEPEAIVLEGLRQLGEPCQSLLEQFYFQRSSMQKIMDKFGYKNKDTAKSQKYKCLSRLRKLIEAQRTKLQYGQ